MKLRMTTKLTLMMLMKVLLAISLRMMNDDDVR